MALITVKNNDYLWEESFNYFSSKGQAHVALWPRSHFDKGPRPDFSHWGWRLTDLPLLWGGDYIEVRTLVSPVILIFILPFRRLRMESMADVWGLSLPARDCGGIHIYPYLLRKGDHIEVRTLVSPVILIFPLFQGRFRTEYHNWSLDSSYQLLTLQVIATTKHKPTRFYSNLC